MTTIKDKVVCITGASSGIGAACAYSCAKAGARLLLISRREQKLQQVAQQCSQAGAADVHIMSLDIADKENVKVNFAQLGSEWQSVDVLINNAGLALGLEHLDNANTDDWDKMIDTNIKGTLYLIRQLLPGMKSRNSGQIINIGSISAYSTYPGGSAYCASKFAVRAINTTLRQELLGTSIRVNLINPGAVNTEFSAVRFSGDKERADLVYQGMKPLVGEDVAEVVLFCMQCPPHVNIDEVLVMPIAQGPGVGTNIYRQTG